tara:strand:+ start:262 stop:597 length:336 start_codon:yes stop_codon:yes gene_type:complete
MTEIIERFLEMIGDEETHLNIQELLTEEELFSYETLVKAMDSIDIMYVGRDLTKITKTYKLDRQQQVAVMAYVKTLELMIKRAKESGAMDMMKDSLPVPEDNTDYSGSMFG